MAGMMTRLRVVPTIELLMSKNFGFINVTFQIPRLQGWTFCLIIYDIAEGTSIIGPFGVASVAWLVGGWFLQIIYSCKSQEALGSCRASGREAKRIDWGFPWKHFRRKLVHKNALFSNMPQMGQTFVSVSFNCPQSCWKRRDSQAHWCTPCRPGGPAFLHLCGCLTQCWWTVDGRTQISLGENHGKKWETTMLERTEPWW